ncbi:DNA internalization-related competence protein ComEC/Rec2 [Vibrio maritimus]|uniref:DNA internalization-related competence protein ComEC/Rec2 n=1 Tax=Vibrio maritimus TaxID=990268 RepID=A0A090U1F0_9VIBR|nr:DNA internalization-related competence protein ComEC/Rec2 [Vibrio maritimus]
MACDAKYCLVDPASLISIACLIKRRWVLSAAFIAMSLALIQGNLFKYQSRVLFQFGTDITIKARVDSYFKKITHGYEVEATVLTINDQKISLFLRPKVLLRSPSALGPGAFVTASVSVNRISGMLNNAGFDREKYLFSKGIVANVTLPAKNHTIVVSRPHWRATFHDVVRNETQKSRFQGLYLALIFGDRSELTNEMRRQLQYSGLSHLIAISGLHVGIVFALGYAIASIFFTFTKVLFPPKTRAWLTLYGWPLCLLSGFLIALLYCALGYFAISTVRALIMLVVISGLLLWQARVHRITIILLASSTVLTLVPFSAASLSFWLSFSAVTLLVITHAWLATRQNVVLQVLSLHLVLSLCFIPIVGYLFQGLSLIGALYNVLFVAWFSVCIVPLSLVAALLAAVSTCSDWLWRLLDIALTPLELAIGFAPLFWLDIGVGDLALLLPLVVLVLLYRWLSRQALYTLALITILIRLGMERESDISVQFFDVGHGLAVAIIQGDEAVIYDTGSANDNFSMVDTVVTPNLIAAGVEHVDGLILSHGDNDHAGGELALRNRWHPTWIRRPEGDTTSTQCVRGTYWRWKALEFKVLWPPKRVSRAYNPHSCVVLVTFEKGNQSKRLLLTGDIEKVSEILLARHLEPLSIDVMSVPHHGSSTSSSSFLHRTINAKNVVASTRFQSRWALPSPRVRAQYQQNGSTWFETGVDGQVIFDFSGQEISVSTTRTEYLDPWYRQMLRSRVE